jgi:hypothetical protein
LLKGCAHGDGGGFVEGTRKDGRDEKKGGGCAPGQQPKAPLPYESRRERSAANRNQKILREETKQTKTGENFAKNAEFLEIALRRRQSSFFFPLRSRRPCAGESILR